MFGDAKLWQLDHYEILLNLFFSVIILGIVALAQLLLNNRLLTCIVLLN